MRPAGKLRKTVRGSGSLGTPHHPRPARHPASGAPGKTTAVAPLLVARGRFPPMCRFALSGQTAGSLFASTQVGETAGLDSSEMCKRISAISSAGETDEASGTEALVSQLTRLLDLGVVGLPELRQMAIDGERVVWLLSWPASAKDPCSS
jgi:hypothetical protein